MSFDFLENEYIDKYSHSEFETDPDKVVSGLSDKEDGNSSPEEVEKEPSSIRSKVTKPKKPKPKKSKRNKFIAAGMVSIMGLFVAGFIALIPLKLEHIVDNLKNHFFASSQDAVSDETENLFSSYFKVLAHTCGSTVSKDCHIKFSSSDPISNLYRVWHQNKLETTMSEKYGIELRKTGTGSNTKYFLKVNGSSETDVTSAVDGDKDIFQEVSRSDVRAAVKNSLSDETKWEQVLYRFKIGRLLEEKYGIKRCIVICQARDAFQTTKEDITSKLTAPTKAAKIYLVDRVITPRNKVLGTAINCLLSNDCNPEQKNETSSNPEQAGEATSDFDNTTTSQWEQIAANAGLEDAAELEATYDAISKNGLSSYLITDMINNLLPDAINVDAADVIPYVGWVNLASQVVHVAGDAGPALKAMSYAINSAAAVQLFSMYSTYVDEIHTGNVDPKVVGSFVNSLGPGSSTSQDPETGGDASAEQTPLYNNLINNNDISPTPSTTTSTSGTSLLNNVLSSAAYAATTSSSSNSPYICANGQPVPTGQLVCSEEKLGGGSYVANDVNSFLHGQGSILLYIANAWHDSIGQVLNIVSGVFGKLLTLGLDVLNLACKSPFKPDEVTVYCNTKDAVAGATTTIAKGVISYVLPSPLSDNNSGGRTFDIMAEGADVAGNSYAQTGLGGQMLKPSQEAEIQNENLSTAQEEFDHQSFFARMFSTSSPYSLISRVADAIPAGNFATTMQNFFTSFVSSPFSKITSSLFSTLGSRSLFAASTAQPDPFGVVQYGYPSGSIDSDPEAYWQANCSDNASQGYQSNEAFKKDSWNQDAANNVDKNTGQGVNTTTNQCLLIMASVGSAGGYFDTSTLTPDDLGDSSSSSSSTNNQVYVIGDSIATGMESQGNLAQTLDNAGWQSDQIDTSSNYDVTNSLAKIQSDSTIISKVGTVVIELGTNNCNFSSSAPTCDDTPTFETQISHMITAIRNINPNVQIYWMNIYSSKSSAYQSINQAITAESQSLNYQVIDWATEATTDSSNYSFGTTSGAYQNTPLGYTNMSGFLTQALGSAPSPQ